MVTAGTSGTGADPGGFVGRGREIGELCQLAAGSRLVTLCGAGGIGKTRLLRALVRVLASEYPDGTFVASLADLSQPDLLTPRLAAVLGVCQEPTAERADTLAAALCGRRLVLAVDGYEQVTGACAALCQRLLDSSPGLLVVAAGREPLKLPGETIWQVPALSLPAAGEDDPARAGRAAAVRLFTSRAAAAAPGFALDAENCAAVVAACRAVGGLPLAIELAAARVRDLGAGQVAAGLSARAGLPGPGEHVIPVPHAATMRAAIGWSHDLLAPAQQVLLRRLCASPSWTLEMTEQVCADDQLPPADCLGLLTALAGTALVAGRGRPRQGSCRVPGAVRDYAAVCLAQAGETEMMGRRVRDYTAQRAEYIVSIAHARVPVPATVLLELFRDYNADARNVRAALTWCLEHGDAEAGLRICTAFDICWVGGGAPGEGVRWVSAFLDGDGPSAPAALRGPALAVRAHLSLHSGDLRGAETSAAAGLAVCRAAGDPHYAAIALNVLGATALGTGRPEDAVRFTGEALELARPALDSWNQIYAFNVRAGALIAAGRPTEARDCAAAALALALGTGHHWGAAEVQRRLGDAALALGDLSAARGHYLEMLPFTRHAMPKPEAARCLADLGGIALRQGDAAQGRAYLAESLQLSLSAGNRAGIAAGLLAFADLAAGEGCPEHAVRLAAAATARCAAAHLPPPGEAQQHRDAATGLGEPQAARLWAAGLELTSREAVQLALDLPAMTGRAALADRPPPR
jgi:predicted ATPase